MGSPLFNGFRKFLCANTSIKPVLSRSRASNSVTEMTHILLLGKGEEGERKEGRKERGREGRKVRSQPLGSAETLHYEKEIEKLGMRNHSLHEVITPSDKKSRRVSSWTTNSLWTGGLCHPETFISNLRKRRRGIKNLSQAFKIVFSKDLLKRFLSPLLETNAGLAENSCIRFIHPGDNNLMSHLCRAHPLSQMSSTT